MTRAEDGWSSYRGRAVEPLVRQSLERLAPVPGLDIAAVGSIKWRDGQPFSTADAAGLRQAASVLPGADDTTSLVAVSRSGFVDGLGEVVRLGPDDLLSAWSG
ncbi:MAG: hypothetical protein ACRDTF_07880 [Pseudonocardiaceae bacterium]